MGTSVAYTPAQVTTALLQLVANGGNAAKTAEMLHDDEFQVPEATLRAWKNDVHSEQYRKLEENYAQELEAEAIERARIRLREADEVEGELLQKARSASPELVPQALRAAADVKAKSGNLLMQLTGRPVAPKDQATGDVVKLLTTMVDKGYLRLAPAVAESIEGSAEDVGERSGTDANEK